MLKRNLCDVLVIILVWIGNYLLHGIDLYYINIIITYISVYVSPSVYVLVVLS